MTVLVFGASGYIGSHLVPRLLAAGHQVRATSRNAEALTGRGWEGVDTVSADALDEELPRPRVRGDSRKAGGSASCNVPVEAAWTAISSIGGRNGWPSFEWAWRLRVMLDRVVGGVGFRRGRRDQNSVRVGTRSTGGASWPSSRDGGSRCSRR